MSSRRHEGDDAPTPIPPADLRRLAPPAASAFGRWLPFDDLPKAGEDASASPRKGVLERCAVMLREDYEQARDAIARLAAAEAEMVKLNEALMDRAASDDASPEWWRGHEAGVAGVAMRWEQALTEPIPSPGVMGCEKLEALRRRTEALRERCGAAEGVVGELPRTKDGVAVTPGMILYWRSANPETIKGVTVSSVVVGGAMSIEDGEELWIPLEWACSTREAALAGGGERDER